MGLKMFYPPCICNLSDSGNFSICPVLCFSLLKVYVQALPLLLQLVRDHMQVIILYLQANADLSSNHASEEAWRSTK